MEKKKQGVKLLAAALMCLLTAGLLTGCGGSGKESGGKGGKSAQTKQDTWEDAMGGKGYVEYEYGAPVSEETEQKKDEKDNSNEGKEDKRPSKMILKRDNGAVWRTLEFTYADNSPTDERDIVNTYDANGNLLYELFTYYAYDGEEMKPSYAQGFYGTVEKGEDPMSSSIAYDGAKAVTLNNTASGAMNWAVTSYDEKGRPIHITEYYKDALVLGEWDYEYEKDKLVQIRRLGGSNLFLAPEYNKDGQIIALYDANAEERTTPEYRMEYDEAGRLVKRTGYNSSYKEPYTQTFTYREDGTLESCRFDQDLPQHELEKPWIPRFGYDETGNLVWESYGYLKGSYGGGDIMLTKYAYHPSGVIAQKSGYELSDKSAGGMRMIYEYTYGEDGLLDRTLEVDYDWKDDITTYGTKEEEYYDNGKVKKRWYVKPSWPDELSVVEYDESGKSSGEKYAEMDKERGGEYKGQFDVGEF